MPSFLPALGRWGMRARSRRGSAGSTGAGAEAPRGWEEEVAGLALALEVSPQGFALRCSRFPRANPAPSPKACPKVSMNHPDTTLMVPVPGASIKAAHVRSRCFGSGGGDRKGHVCPQVSEAVALLQPDPAEVPPQPLLPVWGAGCLSQPGSALLVTAEALPAQCCPQFHPFTTVHDIHLPQTARVSGREGARSPVW